MNKTEEKFLSRSRAAAEAASAAAILVAVLTIGAELWPPLKDALKLVFTHHWLGKSILAVFLFGVVFLLRFRMSASAEQLNRSILWALWLSVLSSLAMSAFFAIHTFG